MHWKTERTHEFEEWWETLSEREQNQVITSLRVVGKVGPTVGRPYVDTVSGSGYPNMKELRPTRTLRVFFAFDPRRVAIILIGGDKAGQVKRFYRQMISRADKIYEAHLRRIAKELSASENEKG